MEAAGQTQQRQWFVLMTKPGAEDGVAQQLVESLRIEVYSPRIELPIRKSRSVSMVIRPLFPCYLFARLDLLKEWKTVSFTRGVVRILGGWTDPKPVSPEVIEAVQARERHPDRVIQYYNFKPDDPVVIKQGPLRDLYGIFEKYTSRRGRVRVLLSLVGSQVSTELDISCLGKV